MNPPLTYRQRADLAIRNAITEKECQPILFIGSGLSRRYIGTPTWHDALEGALTQIKDGGHPYPYYFQLHKADPIAIGTALVDRAHAWAWGKGKARFPKELFD